MRIGIICVIRESWGGSEELWAAMAHEAIAEGHEIIVSAYDCGKLHPKMQALVNKGVKVIFRRGYVEPGIPTWRRILHKILIVLLNFVNNPFKAFFILKPDKILYVGTEYSILEHKSLVKILNSIKTPFYINIQLASDFRQVVAEHNTKFVADFFNSALKIFFVSKQNKISIERHLAIYIKQGITVRNPVNLNNLDYVPYPNNEIIQMAMVGNLILAHKGQDLILDILKDEDWKSKEWHLNIYGEGMDRAFLNNLTHLYNLEGRVTFHGRINDVKQIWIKNNILIMPSIMEGMALSVVEAMICGRPILATNVGGHEDWITNQKEGFLADGPTKISISKALDDAWGNKHTWNDMGKKAREKALKMFDPNPGQTLLKLIN